MRYVCIYTTPDVLRHKQTDPYVYWRFNTLPEPLNRPLIEGENRLYFAVRGFIVGYFTIYGVDQVEDTNKWDVLFDGYNSWNPIMTLIPQNPFQGFKYLDMGD